jgi:hypothetical protein
MTIATRLTSAAALAAVTLIAGATAASAGVDPTLNNPADWEGGGTYSCTKVEHADGLQSFTRATGVAFHVVKAGTSVSTVPGGNGSGYDDFTSKKDISYIITCTPNYGGGY